MFFSYAPLTFKQFYAEKVCIIVKVSFTVLMIFHHFVAVFLWAFRSDKSNAWKYYEDFYSRCGLCVCKRV